MERFPAIRELASASQQEVLKLWEGMGYYSRIRNFHKAAKMVVEEYNGRIPETPEEFRKLPGVGPYITAAVLSIARDIPIPAVDGNVLRVYTRFRGIGEDIRKTAVRNGISLELQEVIPPGAAGDFTQAMMELGALVCTPKSPQCSQCPLQKQCFAFHSGGVERYPYKSPSKTVPQYRVSVGIIVREDKFYIQQRPSEGHLGGLWEFPGGKSEPGETPEQTLIRECREELGCEVTIIKTLPIVRHAYSHFKIQISPFICQSIEEPKPLENQPFQWVTVRQLEDYPFPGANHKFFPDIREYFETQT